MTQFQQIKYRHALYYANLLNSFNQSYRSGKQEDTKTAFDINQRQIELGYTNMYSARMDREAGDLCLRYVLEGGDILTMHQDPRTYISWNTTALEIAEMQNNLLMIAGCLSNLGWSELRYMRYDAAESYFQQALERTNEEDFEQISINPYSGLASVAAERGFLERARDHYIQALSVWKHRGDKRGEAGDLGNLSLVYIRLRDVVQAHICVQQAAAGLIAVGDLGRASAHINNLGIIYAQMNRPWLAEACIEYSISLSRRINNSQELGKSLAHRVNIQIEDGNLDEADKNLEQSLAISKETDDQKAYNMRQVLYAQFGLAPV